MGQRLLEGDRQHNAIRVRNPGIVRYNVKASRAGNEPRNGFNLYFIWPVTSELLTRSV